MDPYHVALWKCVQRYKVMLAESGMPYGDPLYNFLLELERGCHDGLPLMKLNRWLGYIQGVMIERGITTVTAERDWTRPLFRPLDFRTESRVTTLINTLLRSFGFRLTKI
jgi:hypothetical protein